MGDQFCVKWKSDTLDNFDNYMKKLDVNFILRKAGENSTTVMDVSKNGDAWIWKYKIAFKKGELNFKLGEEFDEVTPDGRKVKSTFTLEGDKLVQIQRGKPFDTTISRYVGEDGILYETCTVEDVVCNRTYKRTE